MPPIYSSHNLTEGTEIEAIHPLTGHWHPGIIESTYDETTRSGYQLWVNLNFEDDPKIRTVDSHDLIKLEDKPDALGIDQKHIYPEYLGMSPKEALEVALNDEDRKPMRSINTKIDRPIDELQRETNAKRMYIHFVEADNGDRDIIIAESEHAEDNVKLAIPFLTHNPLFFYRDKCNSHALHGVNNAEALAMNPDRINGWAWHHGHAEVEGGKLRYTDKYLDRADLEPPAVHCWINHNHE